MKSKVSIGFAIDIVLYALIMNPDVIFSLYEEYQFLGLNVNNDNNLINNIITYGLESISNEYTTDEDGTEMNEIVNGITGHSHLPPSQWRYPSSFHLTTLYNPSSMPEHFAIKVFIDNQNKKNIEIKVKGMVYLPHKLITIFVNVDTSIQNKIPHITLLLNEYQAKDSNYILERIFNFGKCLHDYYYYYSLFNIKILNDIIIRLYDIEVLNKKEKMFIIFFKDDFTLHSHFKPYKNK